MRIAFVCGSLELGKDGVGDYTRILATEMVRQKHQVTLIALNDSHITEEFSGTQKQDYTELSVLRLPSILSASYRFKQTKLWVDAFNPEWLSLQYVAYGFQRKGLPFGLGKKLKILGEGRKWHIMFHELWIGRTNLKNTFISALQEQLLTSLIQTLKPLCVHTQLPTYYSILKQKTKAVRKLPLFSNIQVADSVITKDDKFRIAFFSQAEVSPTILLFIYNLEMLLKNKRQLEILFIGRMTHTLQKVGKHVEQLYNLSSVIKYTGFLDEQTISATIQTCQLGITSVPRHALGKSGSIAAFISHGIPVAAPICLPGYDSSEIGFFSATLRSAVMQEPTLHDFIAATKAVQIAREEITSKAIATQFMRDLRYQ